MEILEDLSLKLILKDWGNISHNAYLPFYWSWTGDNGIWRRDFEIEDETPSERYSGSTLTSALDTPKLPLQIYLETSTK